MKNKRAEVQTVGTRRDASAGADLKSRLKSHAVTIESNGHTLEAENNGSQRNVTVVTPTKE